MALVSADHQLKEVPKFHVKSGRDGRDVAIKYWVCSEASHRTDATARAVRTFAWAKSYISAKVLLSKLLEDDCGTTYCSESALFLFVSQPDEVDVKKLPEIQPNDVFSLQTGLTIFQIQVVPLEVPRGRLVRSTLDLAAGSLVSLMVKSLHIAHGSLRAWDVELAAYCRVSEADPLPEGAEGKPIRLLIEQLVPDREATSEVTLHHNPPRECYASIFSRVVDHPQLATVVHTPTDQPDWRSASNALQLGFLSAKKGKVDQALRRLLWNGVPHLYRRPFWLAVSGGLATLRTTPRNYDAALATLYGHKEKYMDPTAAILPSRNQSFVPHDAKVPTFGGSFDRDLPGPFGVLTKEGQRQAKVLACVIHETHPSLTHCPALPVLLPFLLMFLSAEEAYATTCCLLHISAVGGFPWYLRTNSQEHEIALAWFEALFHQRCTAVFDHLYRIKFNLRQLLEEWFTSFFSHHLPFYGSLQVMDVFLAEGFPALIKVALAIWKLKEKEVVACTTPKAVRDFLSEGLQQMDVPLLFRTAYGITLTSDEVPFSRIKPQSHTDGTVDIPDETDHRETAGAGPLPGPFEESPQKAVPRFLQPMKHRFSHDPTRRSSLNRKAPLSATMQSSTAEDVVTVEEEPEPFHRPKLEELDEFDEDAIRARALPAPAVPQIAGVDFSAMTPTRGRELEAFARGGTLAARTTRARSLEPGDHRGRPEDTGNGPPSVSEVVSLLGLTSPTSVKMEHDNTSWRLDVPASAIVLYKKGGQSSPASTGDSTPRVLGTSPVSDTVLVASPNSGGWKESPLPIPRGVSPVLDMQHMPVLPLNLLGLDGTPPVLGGVLVRYQSPHEAESAPIALGGSGSLVPATFGGVTSLGNGGSRRPSAQGSPSARGNSPSSHPKSLAKPANFDLRLSVLGELQGNPQPLGNGSAPNAIAPAAIGHVARPMLDGPVPLTEEFNNPSPPAAALAGPQGPTPPNGPSPPLGVVRGGSFKRKNA